METETVLLLAGLMFAAAVLYASVGHAGASAYLGIMALAGVAPEAMRPTALAVVLGALVGTAFSLGGASRPMLLRLNAAVLAIAGAKLIFL